VSAFGLLATPPPVLPTPVLTPAGGSYAAAQSVTITDGNAGAAIYYTTNGTTPSATNGTRYSGPISVASSETVAAVAVLSGYTTSAAASATYTIGGTSTPVINDPTGFSTTSGLSLVNGASLVGTGLQLTASSQAYAVSAVWSAAPVNVQSFTTDFTFQQTPAAGNTADGMTFTIQNASATALGAFGGGLGYQGIGTSVAVKFDLYSNAGEGSDSTGFYTNGAAPTVPALDMSASGVNLHAGHVMHGNLAYNGTTLTLTLTDTVTGAIYTASSAINIPATVGATTAYVGFTAGNGGLTATQSVLSWTYVAN